MKQLFTPLTPDAHRTLERLPEVLDAVLPMKGAHKRDLPQAVADLSLRLTAERGGHSLPYWSSPRFVSAYMWYFLPWNILRLAKMLPNLDLPAPTPLPLTAEGDACPRLLVDVGAGPLTLPLALWCAFPQWRSLPLTVLCVDAAPQPMHIGKRIFARLAGADSPWRIVTRRAPLDSFAREAAQLPELLRGVPWLVTAGNVLNELQGRGAVPTWQRLEDFALQLGQMLRRGMNMARAVLPLRGRLTDFAPRALCVEPGTRLGGKTIGTLRSFLLEAQEDGEDTGLHIAAPCRCLSACPLENSRTWCHFTTDAVDAPAWLTRLSAAAELPKDSVSLSFALLAARGQREPLDRDAREARVISSPLRVPALRGAARYACGKGGLLLLEDAADAPSGALVRVGDAEGRDVKSGADIVPLGEKLLRLAVADGTGDAGCVPSRHAQATGGAAGHNGVAAHTAADNPRRRGGGHPRGADDVHRHPEDATRQSENAVRYGDEKRRRFPAPAGAS